MRQFLRTPKGSLLVIFTALLALAAAAVGWQSALPHILTAVLAATLVELAGARLPGRPVQRASSALTPGMIVGFFPDPATPFAITAAVAILATLSKHLLSTNRWH